MEKWIDDNRDQLEKLALILGILYLTIRLLKVKNLYLIGGLAFFSNGSKFILSFIIKKVFEDLLPKLAPDEKLLIFLVGTL